MATRFPCLLAAVLLASALSACGKSQEGVGGMPTLPVGVVTVQREDVPLDEKPRDLEWRGARRESLEEICRELGDERLLQRVPRWRG